MEFILKMCLQNSVTEDPIWGQNFRKNIGCKPSGPGDFKGPNEWIAFIIFVSLNGLINKETSVSDNELWVDEWKKYWEEFLEVVKIVNNLSFDECQIKNPFIIIVF